MKKVLIYYSTYELNTNSKKSVPRLVASLIAAFEKKFEVTFFSFSQTYSDEKIATAPVQLPITTKIKRLKFLYNKLPFVKKKNDNAIKLLLVNRFLKKNIINFDAIVAIKHTDLQNLKTLYRKAKLLYWFHNVPHSNSMADFDTWNFADHIISPSVTTYFRIMAKVEPLFIAPQWHIIRNWADGVFLSKDDALDASLREKHRIDNNTTVIIYTGGKPLFKGSYIVTAVAEQLTPAPNQKNVLIFAGEGSEQSEYVLGQTRCIKTGFLSPAMLASYMRISNFGLMSSLGYEHSPLTILEMAHTNTLPITSDVGGVTEITGNDYPFLINTPHVVSCWLKKLHEAMAMSANERELILQKLQHKIKTEFCEEKSITEFINIIS